MHPEGRAQVWVQMVRLRGASVNPKVNIRGEIRPGRKEGRLGQAPYSAADLSPTAAGP